MKARAALFYVYVKRVKGDCFHTAKLVANIKHARYFGIFYFIFLQSVRSLQHCCCLQEANRNKSDLYRLGNLVQPANEQLVGQDSQGTSWNSPEKISWHALVKGTNALFLVDHLDCMNDSLVLWWMGRLVLKSCPDHFMRVRRNTGCHLGRRRCNQNVRTAHLIRIRCLYNRGKESETAPCEYRRGSLQAPQR